MTSRALVILSGGQDSTTCLAIAKKQFEEVHAVTFEYGQKHSIELASAREVARLMGVTSHEVITMGKILKGTSPLVNEESTLGKYESADELPGGIEPTFVPGRNILFLTLAANRAAALGIKDIFTGLCDEDFGGYPDCRQSFVEVMQQSIGEGIWGDPDAFTIHTPLMRLNKADSVKLAANVLGEQFEEVMGATHTCYDGIKGGCGKCHACHLRDRGFREAGIDDPVWKYRLVAA
jgi:7-cyano-7-deazaguanine synthase